eukprot:11790465-Prorocentrum_lima.AAC.1
MCIRDRERLVTLPIRSSLYLPCCPQQNLADRGKLVQFKDIPSDITEPGDGLVTEPGPDW